MIRISLPYIIEFVVSLEGLDQITAGRSLGDVYAYAYNAKLKIEELFGASLYASAIRSSRLLGTTLSTTLDGLLRRDISESATPLDQWQVRTQRDQFRTAFLAELGVMPSFFVTQKGGFDTNILLDQPHLIFPPSIISKVPEVLPDVLASGRALAFDLPTAGGFHLFRILEAVLRRYYLEVTGGAAAPKVRTIGTYVRALRKAKCGDEAILATLDQIREFHRNPLVHPQFLLTIDQALSLVGIVRSAVDTMLTKLPEIAPQPDIASMFAVSVDD